MDEIVKLADQLGKAIADSQAVSKYRAAREAMHADADTSKLLQEFMAQSSKLHKLAQEQKPIEPEDKRTMNDLQAQVAAQDAFKTFSATQVEYIDIMRKVSQAILAHLRDVEGAPPGASDG
ncbi:MAG: YlbF/YmcA family competence regulator [Planctomycetota bacterium]|jgi:cell fate (sporulation/competence/biofilm development) regulator YlbF (YheA/YmcA/DUF963 family)